METIVALFEESIQDHNFFKSEKKDIKSAILDKKFSKREFDLLRSKVFDIAFKYTSSIPAEKLLQWVEVANKLTLLQKEDAQENDNRAYFSPGRECQAAIITQIKSARVSLHICVFTISDNEITKAIEEAFRKRIDVKIITDNDKTFDRGSDIQQLHDKGVDIKIDRTDSHMHHKFCLIDNKTLLTGSYNWTRSAALYNQENVLITEESSLIKSYSKEFDKLWDTLKNY
jgi:cardiolipin hydrolase